MEERSDVRRLPRGERCTQCGDRKFYVENGMRFCAANGHEIEGFVQFDIGDLDDSGKMGAVSKRQKEIREKERKQLTGIEGKKLYLEALQLILRHQLLWLVREKGHREELETVVHDLWDLRVRAFGSIAPEENTGDGNLEVFSSQPVTDDSGDDDAQLFPTKSLTWDPDRGPDWPMPRMVETLALCYLGCLLLRIPTRIGQFSKWANGGHLPYRRIYYELPQEVQDRMPSAYTRILKIPAHTPLDEGELHGVVMQLASGYHHNYDMVFPGLNHIPMLVQYGKLLCLPIESILAAQALSEELGCTFGLPVTKSRIFPVDQPEILIPSLIIVSSKIIFPLRVHSSTPRHSVSPFQLNWQRWAEIMEESQENDDSASRPIVDSRTVTTEQVVSMSEEELNEYFRQIASLADKKNDNPITQFFPIEERPQPGPLFPDILNSERTQRIRDIMGQTIVEISSNEAESGSQRYIYEAFRTVDDIPVTAKTLYIVTAKVAGVRLETLVRAVYMLEQRIVNWQRKRRRATAEGSM